GHLAGVICHNSAITIPTHCHQSAVCLSSPAVILTRGGRHEETFPFFRSRTIGRAGRAAHSLCRHVSVARSRSTARVRNGCRVGGGGLFRARRVAAPKTPHRALGPVGFSFDRGSLVRDDAHTGHRSCARHLGRGGGGRHLP